MLVSSWPEDAAERWPNFTAAEMECRCGCGALPDPQLMDVLQMLRDLVGAACAVSSGARCAAHNEAVSDTGPNGPHTTGLAADIACRGVHARAVLDAAVRLGVPRIGISQAGEPAGRFIHLDLLAGRGAPLWTY